MPETIPLTVDRRPAGLAAWLARPAVTGWAMVMPAVLGLVLFNLLPAVRAVRISFTDWNLLRPARDVGWANYAQLLADDRFWHGMGLSGLYVLLNIPLQTALGLFLALVMYHLTRSLFVKSALLLPYLLSNVLVAMIWLWLLDPTLGTVNHLLQQLGLPGQPFFSRRPSRRCSPWHSSTCGGTWGWWPCCSWRGCRTSRCRCTRQRHWRAPTPGKPFALSPGRCCARCWCLCW
jgi:ABC-type sugar transport system permease subunit